MDFAALGGFDASPVCYSLSHTRIASECEKSFAPGSAVVARMTCVATGTGLLSRSNGISAIEREVMTVRRIVTNLERAEQSGSREFFVDTLGLEIAMDMGWISTLAAPGHPAAQLSLLTHDDSAPVVPALSIEVDNVDAIHSACVEQNLEIVHPLTDEPWGVRRFFVREPGGLIVNILDHGGSNST